MHPGQLRSEGFVARVLVDWTRFGVHLGLGEAGEFFVFFGHGCGGGVEFGGGDVCLGGVAWRAGLGGE